MAVKQTDVLIPGQILSSPALASSVFTMFDATGVKSARNTSVALIGNFAPRKCGIATFTTDIFEKLREYRNEIDVSVYALDDADAPLSYEGVTATIDRNDPVAYKTAADEMNASGVDTVWLQHEYGIFGGDRGDMVLDLVDAIAAPLILTLHTVLVDPDPKQEAILRHLIARSSRIMVMSRQSRDLLAERYGAPHEILTVIEHGAPDRPFGRQDQFKQVLGHDGRTVMMTFGLLGPGKGIERVIEALPAIVERFPEVLYRVVGATHPNLVAEQGEAYRERLVELAEGLGVARHVEWDNRFLENEELLDQLEASDIYITPYFNLQQSTSGTLSYAVACGKAVVSTPYVHASELLADDVGVLIEPDSAQAIADAVINLLDNPDRLAALQRRAYAKGRETIWPEFAAATARLVAEAAAPSPRHVPVCATPGIEGFLAMCDGTGMLQHAIGIVPDRRHGYCLDDNVRALMLATVATTLDHDHRASLTATFASFIQHAWNPDRGRFRNFMSFDRTWCEDVGSDDSNGRALWALGDLFEKTSDPQIREWAWRWYDTALPRLAELGSPRAIAFAMLGAAAALRARPDHGASRTLLTAGAETLTRLLAASRRPDWAWFEVVLGYDNPRLCQALIEASDLLDHRDARDEAKKAGIETLRWIAERQTSSEGHFRPIGSDSFGKVHAQMPFDQQPLEAQATIEAARAALTATGDRFWAEHARIAWNWFFGANDRGVVLADLDTGRCRDGINPRGANENCGAESILAFQLSHYSMLAIADRDMVSAGEYLGSGALHPQ